MLGLCNAAAKEPRITAGSGNGPELQRRATELHITGRREFEEHLNASEKQAAYRDLLLRYGVDPEAPSVRDLGRPALLLAEQPGCWLTPRDMVRARLVERLLRELPLDRKLSGARALSHDRFTADGDKGILVEFHLHPQLGPVRLVGSKFIKKHEHRTYSSLVLSGSSLKRIATTWDYAVLMLKTAGISPSKFSKVLTTVFDSSPLRGARDILPPTNEPAELLRLGEELAECDTASAKRALVYARARLHEGVAWDQYWSLVNGRVLGLKIQALSPLLGRLLLAIKDPQQLGRTLLAESGEADGPISVAGIVTEDRRYCVVMFDPDTGKFFIERPRGRQEIQWEDVRASAAAATGSRPSGVLEYLLLAAFGFYLAVDSGDSLQAFHRTVCDIHRNQTGCAFPWITCATEGPLSTATGNHFIDSYRPSFPDLQAAELDRFFRG